MTDRIPLIEPVVGEEELENVQSVLDSGYMTQGPYTREFEDRFAEIAGTDHAIAVTSCTTGLELALEGVGVSAGNEVVLPAFTHPATGNVIERLGAEPVLVDVDRETYNVDPDSIQRAVTEETSAILPVSWGGQPLDADPIRDVAEEHGLPVVEDAACSAGASYDGEPTGSQFDVSVFSFHPRKVLTTGEGGMVTTDDAALTRSMRSVKNFGTDPAGGRPGFVRANATNYRFSDILAAVGVAQLEKLDRIVSRRREIARRYTDLLAPVDGVRPPRVPAAADHVYQSYCVYLDLERDGMRDELIDEMADENIETQIGTYALHLTDAFEHARRAGSLSNSTSLAEHLLTLPIAHSMSAEQQGDVVEELERAVSRLG